MKLKHVVTVVCSALMILIFGLYSAISTPAEEKHIKVGFLYVGDGSNPYTNNFMRAEKDIEETYGDKVETVAMYNVPEGENVYAVLDELIDQECDMIFATSYGYSSYMKEYAEKYPDIEFCQATGDNANTDPVLDNYHTYMGFVYEGRYISGVVAGMKMKELLDQGLITEDDLWIGYIGAFPFAEVISGYTAFYLGASSVVPNVKMRVKYTNSWGDYKLEKKYAEELISEGCIIISQHSDTTGPAVACENTSADTIVYHVGYNQNMISVAPTTSLIGCRINWSPYMVDAVGAVMKGETIEDEIDAKTFGNDSGAGFNKGWIQMLNLNELIAADGTREEINRLEKQFKSGGVDVFKGDYIGVDPYNPEDTIDLNDGFDENSSASAPAFHYILQDVIIIEE